MTLDMMITEARMEGEQQGIQQATQQTRVKTAQNMLKDGLPPETVAKYSELTLEEVKALKTST